MTVDSLRRLVLERDKQHNSARQMRVTTRGVERKRICVACRRPASAEAYRAKWLAGNPMPTRCPRRCAIRGDVASGYITPKQHRQWHEDLYVSARMPPFSVVWACPLCDGHLVEVEW